MADIIRPYLRNVGGQVGSAETNVTVTVNTNTATRQDYYWYYRLGVDNLYTAAYPQVVVEAVYDPGTNEPYVVSSETGNVFVAASPEEFSYDYDGNLLSDGRFEYAWDAENRLISATTIEGLPEDVPVVHVEFDYDYQSRRVGKTVYEWDAGVTNWSLTETRQNVFNGWALIREDVSGDAVTTNWYVHGLDLSGTLTEAGGVGGLLAATFGTNTCAYGYDGNGNVSELVNVQTGEIQTHYQYSPFGETIVATGDLALENKFRFSTKPAEDNTGLVLYEHRAYSPSLCRFINRDPIGERGGMGDIGVKSKDATNVLTKYAENG